MSLKRPFPVSRQVTGDVSYQPSKMSRTVPKPSAGIRSYTNAAIRKAVQAARETKKVHERNQEISLSTIGGGGYYIYDFPTPQLGASSEDRIGCKISPTRISLKWLLNNNSTKDVFCRILVLRSKQGRAYANADLMNKVFDGTGGYDGTVTGTVHDLIAPINEEELQVVRDFNVHVGPGQNNNTAVSTVKLGSVVFKPSAQMTFTDDGAVDSVNNRYILVLMPRRGDNDESTGETIEFSYDMTMLFKD